MFVVVPEEARTLTWSRVQTLLLVAEVLSPSTARGDRMLPSRSPSRSCFGRSDSTRQSRGLEGEATLVEPRLGQAREPLQHAVTLQDRRVNAEADARIAPLDLVEGRTRNQRPVGRSRDRDTAPPAQIP